MTVHDVFGTVADGDQLDDGYFNGILASGNIDMQVYAPNSVVQGTWAIAVSAESVVGWIHNNVTHAINDEVDYKVVLTPGTYTLKVIHSTASSHGIMSFYLGTTLIGTVDAYSAGAQLYNVVSTVTGIVVATSNIFDFKIKIESKNASSTNYYIYINLVAMYRTA